MNLEKLFQMQKELDDRILAEHPIQEGEDRLAKKILALQVELGELANCWRGFKYWSYNQKPKTEELGECPLCKGTGDLGTVWAENCIECGGSGKVVVKNPLLEEYVDCLHFFLSIGNELGISKRVNIEKSATKDLMTLFAKINRYVSEMWWEVHDRTELAGVKWFFAIQNFLRLGEMLGYTWEQVEAAYIRKNAINHNRQKNGY